MSELPSGTVTFLFTDIEGSTKLAQQFRDAMREKIGDHTFQNSKIDDAEFTRLSAEGRTMTVEQAIAFALEE